LLLPAGKATPSPPTGPALGQRGLNIMEFCKAFNARTQSIAPGTPLPVRITYFSDKTFVFDIKKPPVSYMLKQLAGLKSGSNATGKTIVAKVKVKDLRKIAEEKIEDMNTDSIEEAITMIIGTAKSMGIEVQDE